MQRAGRIIPVIALITASACDPASPTAVLVDTARLSPSGLMAKQGATSSQILFTKVIQLSFSSDLEVFAMNDDGTGVIPLAQDVSYRESEASWAPDGKHVLFTRGDNGGLGRFVAVMNADGTGITQLTFPGTGVYDLTPLAFGKQIVFGRFNVSTGFSTDVIYLINADGTGLMQLTEGPNDRQPWPSPKGGTVAFERNGDIYVLDVATKALTNLTNSETYEWEPVYSPSAKQIAFGRPGSSGGLFVMNSDGTAETRLTTNVGFSVDRYPRWSPDGRRIAFTSQRDGELDIYVINVDGAGMTNITRTPLVKETVTAWARN